VARLQQTNLRTEDSAEALKEFEEELKADPTNANASYEMADIHRKSGHLENAQELFEAALKNYPDFEEAQVGLGRALIALEKPEDALPHLQKSIALDPEDDVPYFHLAQVYKLIGKEPERQKALAEFRRIRAQRSGQRETVLFSPRDVTRQELDPNAAP
jgi:predicted Zn-dependent protease